MKLKIVYPTELHEKLIKELENGRADILELNKKMEKIKSVGAIYDFTDDFEIRTAVLTINFLGLGAIKGAFIKIMQKQKIYKECVITEIE